MEMRDLLEKMSKFAGEKAGQKPGDQWRGTDSAPPGKKLVGDSMLKDLSKGKTPKSKEQELAEEFQAFLEAEFKDTVDRRPSRKGARHSRGHEPKSGYKTIKADEAASSEYTVVIDRRGREKPVTGTMSELLDYFGYTLEVGKSYEHERGRYKINLNPKNVQQLVDALNKAATNASANSAPSTYYSVGEQQVAEGVPYKATNPHPALQDPVIKKVLKQMRPGLTGLEMNNEAFLYFAYELGKTRAREMWEDYGPAIKYGYQSGIGVNEGWESGPEEYKEPYDDADDAYERHRQEKIDTEAEKEWAKLPKVSTYKLLGRGPNMEPNYEFDGKEYDTLEAAIEARKKLMADPKTPHPEHIGIQTLTRVVDKEQTDEAVQGGGHIKNLEDYTTKRDYIYKQLADPKQADNYSHFRQALFDLNRLAKEQGIEIEESRAHKQLATWFKNRELAQKYASGEVKIPTPQERKAELEKSKEPVKEYGATSTGSPTSGNNISLAKPNDPEVAKKVSQATTTLKSATQSTAPNTSIAKALDAASQGKPVTATDMKALEPMMDVIQKTATDPELANQFKQLVQKVRQAKV